jgi:D-alanyl-D-alanine carboxypeptidase
MRDYLSGFSGVARRFIITTIVLVFSVVANAEPKASALTTAATIAPIFSEAAIDHLMAEKMREQFIPGATLAIVHRGKVIYVKAYGKANLEHDLPMTTDSVLMVGSVSKPMLAVAIARLHEQGKLKFDDPIANYIPDTPKAWGEVTLRHLLNHTSGIVRESPAFDGNKIAADIDLIKATFALPLDFPTGTKSQYCNICYFALAEVITRVSGKPWPEFMAEQIFVPAGMSATRTASPTALIPRRATSYNSKNGVYVNEREYAALRPSGAFISSINDLVKWEAALFNNRLISAETLNSMAIPAKLKNGSIIPFSGPSTGYGLGWATSHFDGEPRISHGGALAGFRSIYARYPDRGVAIVLLTNSATANLQNVEPLIAKIVFGR